MRSITASWPSLALLGAFIALAQAQNSTSSSGEDNMKIGWQDGPNQRGTLTILWSCLSTIIACTWTILHLNVPGTCDSTWWRILTKAKWMVVTLLFPEFLFSKAVCELQMAVDDFQMMSEKIILLGSDFKWRVTYRRRHRFLRNVLHLSLGSRLYAKSTETREKLPEPRGADVPGSISADHDYAQKEFGAVHRSSNQKDANLQPPRKREWTLAHSYFANMGGFERHYKQVATCDPEGLCTEAKSNPVTAYALVNCCVGSPHDPLPELVLDRDDIEDKSKADWFLKSIAVVQISWLLVSVIDRAATHLPITQLEICTSAFAILAIATYLANWSKPKDVGRPHQLKSIDISQCEAWKYFGEPFVRRLYQPSESGKLEDEEHAESKIARECYRIGNDFVRLDGFLPPMTVAMALTTAIFGGLHCLAWNFAFPTRIEMLIWMVASVLSATIPLTSLLVNMVVISKIHHALSQCAGKLEDKVNHFCGAERERDNLDPSRLQLSLTKVSESESPAKEIYTFYYNMDNFIRLKIRHRLVFDSYDTAQEKTLSHLANDNRKQQLEKELLALGLHQKHISLLFDLLSSQGKEGMRQTKSCLYGVIRPCNRVAGIITVVGGVLYASVRLILLSLAFCALRYVPEGVYTTSWTSFLPNIS